MLALSVVSVAALVGGLGLTQVAVRHLAVTGERPGEVRGIIRSLLLTGAAGAIGAAVLYQAVGKGVAHAFNAPLLRPLTLGLGVWAAALALQTLLAEIFRGLHNLRAAALLGGPVSAVLTLTALLFLRGIGASVTLAHIVTIGIGSAVAGMVLSAALLAGQVRRLPAAVPASAPSPRRLLSVALPLLATTVVMVASGQLDLWLLGATRPHEEVAAYAVAARTAALAGLPLLIVNGALAPLVADLYSGGRTAELQRLLHSAALAAAMPTTVIAVTFTVASAPMLSLVYGTAYRPGALPLALLGLGQTASAWAGSCALVLAMVGRQRTLVTVTAATGAVTAAALWGIVPSTGATGAAAVAAGGLALQNAALLVALRRETGLSTLARPQDLWLAWRLAGSLLSRAGRTP